MKPCYFWMGIMESLPSFIFLRILSNFLRKLANNLGKYGHIHWSGVRRVEPPEASEF